MKHLAILSAATALAACSQAPDPAASGSAAADATGKSESTGDSAALSKPVDEWRHYRNQRFGFAISVPPGFTAKAPPQNGDGRVFTFEDTTMRISAHHNIEDSFADQITAARRGLVLEVQQRTSPRTWRATSKSENGVRTLVGLARAGNRLITARFEYPANTADLERQLGHALDSLMIVEHAGPLTYEFEPERFALMDATISLPGNHDHAIAASKLIPWSRAEQLGTKSCRYGQSGRTQTCDANKEAGLAFAVLDQTLSALRKSVPDALAQPSKLAGRGGFRAVEQAEGAGTSYAFVPAGSQTVAVVQRWRNAEDKAAFQGLLRNLSLTDDRRSAMRWNFTETSGPKLAYGKPATDKVRLVLRCDGSGEIAFSFLRPETVKIGKTLTVQSDGASESVKPTATPSQLSGVSVSARLSMQAQVSRRQ